YQGFDFIQSGVSGARRNRAIVFASDGFIYGVGNDHRQVAKIDPSDGTRTVAFAPVSTHNNSGHVGIGYNGSNLFVVESEIYNRVEEYTVAGSHQGNHSFPAGRRLVDITWDGANWWATTFSGEIIRMDSSFNERLSIPGPNA